MEACLTDLTQFSRRQSGWCDTTSLDFRSSMQLTIAIPTYNRNTLLLQNLARLLPQFSAGCRLMVVDNASDVPVEDEVRALLADFPAVEFELVRNIVNIGGNANILRCFELCQTQYIWILGDDDPIQPDALATVLRYLESHPDCFYFNFPFDDNRAQTFITQGLEEFIDRLDLSANIPWVSTSIYQVETMRANLKLGYQHAFSMLPHVAMLLVSIGKNGRCCLASERIIELEPGGAPLEAQWSKVSFALAAPTVYDVPLSSAQREKLARKLLVTYWGEGIDLRFVTHQLLIEFFQHGDHRNTLYFFDQICARGYYLNRTPRRRAHVRLCRLMLRYPRLTAVAFYLVKRKRLSKMSLQDRYERM
jgi:abequosyltransferase